MMKVLYNEQYVKKLDGLVSKIGGRLELAAIARMASRQQVVEAQAVLFDYSPRSVPDFSIKVVYPSGKSELFPMYKVPSLLEIGFNTGYWLNRMVAAKTDTVRTIGVDVNEEAVNKALAQGAIPPDMPTLKFEGDLPVVEQLRVPYVPSQHKNILEAAVMDMQALEFDDATFNVILARHVLEHLPDPAKGLEEAIRVAEPGGLIVLTYPFEPVRGLTALPSAIAATYNPFSARKMHLHTLTPGKVARMTDPSYIHSDLSGLKFVPMPVWVHILIRNVTPYNRADYTPFFRRSSAAN